MLKVKKRSKCNVHSKKKMKIVLLLGVVLVSFFLVIVLAGALVPLHLFLLAVISFVVLLRVRSS
jgi:cytochrome c biogenesis factor